MVSVKFQCRPRVLTARLRLARSVFQWFVMFFVVILLDFQSFFWMSGIFTRLARHQVFVLCRSFDCRNFRRHLTYLRQRGRKLQPSVHHQRSSTYSSPGGAKNWAVQHCDQPPSAEWKLNTLVQQSL